jgi:hypothetical protein
MMSFDRDRRIGERINLSLPLIVQCRESLDYEWLERTELLDVSPFGARFLLTRPTEPGRLMYLITNLPWQLRCFDHDEEDYRVWAVVRHVVTLPPQEEGAKRFMVGTAFIGKKPPESFEKDPAKRYEIEPAPIAGGGWQLKNYPKSGKGDPVQRPVRLNLPVEVSIEVFDEEGEVTERERTITKNLSWRGALVLSKLNLERGRFIRLSSVQYPLSVIAVVRARRMGSDGIARLHLEFMNWQWPLE